MNSYGVSRSQQVKSFYAFCACVRSLRACIQKARALTCSASKAAALLQGKWRVHVLCAMRGGPVRLGQLSRLLPEASKKVLMTESKQLVSSGLVERGDLSDGGVVRQWNMTSSNP